MITPHEHLYEPTKIMLSDSQVKQSSQKASLISELPAYPFSTMHPQTLKSLANARDFMRASYEMPLRLPDISAQANLSPYHFLRVHKETFRETPHEFLTRLRIERAKTLLSKGSHNVSEVCFSVGYSSVGSFSVLFTRRVGLPPSEYRRYARPGVVVPREVRTLFIPSCFLSMVRGLSG